MPSLSDVAVLMPVVMVGMRLPDGLASMVEGDTGWHVRAGEWMLQNRQIPREDLFSFTKSGEPWYAWEWLWEVLFGWLHQVGGLNAVVLGSLFLLSATFLLLYRLIRRKTGSAVLAIGLTLLAEFASSIHWLARPHLVTLLLLVVSLWVIDVARAGRWNALWVLPLMTLAWVNLHGGFLALLVVLACLAAGEVVSGAVTPDAGERWQALRRAGRYMAVWAACGAASVVNPYGVRLHAHLWNYLTDGYALGNIVEFGSVSFQHPLARYFEAYLFLALPAAWWCLSRRRTGDAFVLLAWSHLALQSGRHIAIVALVAAPVVAEFLKACWEAWRASVMAQWLRTATEEAAEIASEFSAMDRRASIPLCGVAGLCAVSFLALSATPPPRWQAQFPRHAYPVAAVEELRDRLPERVFTNDEWGDYLIYRMPQRKVFVDGRSDFYGPDFGAAYVHVLEARHEWPKTLQRYGVEAALLPVDSALAGAMKESPRWRVVYDDGLAIAFQRIGATGTPARAYVPGPASITRTHNNGTS